jgi:hypothetical protein
MLWGFNRVVKLSIFFAFWFLVTKVDLGPQSLLFMDWWWFLSPRAGRRFGNWPKNARLSEPINMTIHWKALEEHFPLVPLEFSFNHFRGQNAFSEFFLQKTSVLNSLNPTSRFCGFKVPLSDNRWKRWFSRYFGGVPDSYFVLRCLLYISF